MTKAELIEILDDVPNESEIDIYDLRTFTHPAFSIDKNSNFNYESGTPIITIEILESENESDKN